MPLGSAQGSIDHRNLSQDPPVDPSKDKFALLPIIQKFATPRLQADLPCRQIETRHTNPDFCDRVDIIDKLDRALLRAPPELRHAAIYGLQGQGKSEVALQWTYMRKDRFDAIFWIQADTEAKLKQGD